MSGSRLIGGRPITLKKNPNRRLVGDGVSSYPLIQRPERAIAQQRAGLRTRGGLLGLAFGWALDGRGGFSVAKSAPPLKVENF